MIGETGFKFRNCNRFLQKNKVIAFDFWKSYPHLCLLESSSCFTDTFYKHDSPQASPSWEFFD